MRHSSVLFALALIAPIFAASLAEAHGPTRQKVTETIVIDAPVDKVWAVLGNFQDMTWHPLIAKTEGKGGNSVNATRVLTLKAGGITDELLTKYQDGKMMFYEITKVDVKVLPVSNFSSRFTVEDQEGKTLVKWRTAFYRGYPNNDPPPELSDEAAVKSVTAHIKAGLKGLKAKIEGGGS